MPNRLHVLLVENAANGASSLKAALDGSGRARSHVARGPEHAVATLRMQRVDAVVIGLSTNGDGVTLTHRIRELDPALPVFIICGDPPPERCVEALAVGASACLTEPVDPGELLRRIEDAVRVRPPRTPSSNGNGKPCLEARDLLSGDHPRLDVVRRFARQVARVPETRVLITGESGTGKSCLAQLIHQLSGATGRYMKLNCASLPPALLESELFGHERGAFTDARTMKRGLLEVANEGTVLLDEIGSMPIELQAKLLLFLETREIRRVGGVDSIPVRCRIIAATNHDLKQLAREGRFREDLLYRLDVATIEMPPLRAMPEVIAQLAQRFVREIAGELRIPVPECRLQQLERLVAYDWPGNVRELRNVMERSLVLAGEDELEFLMPPVDRSRVPSAGTITLEYGLSLEDVERRYLAATLQSGPAELQRVAISLGISRKTLWQKRRRFGL